MSKDNQRSKSKSRSLKGYRGITQEMIDRFDRELEGHDQSRSEEDKIPVRQEEGEADEPDCAGKRAYEVGYGKPPLHSRIKRGEVRNPKGRGKRNRNFKTDVREILVEKIPVKRGGQQHMVSSQRASLLRLREKALHGDPRALDRLLGLARIYNDEEQNAGPMPSKPEDAEILRAYRERLVREQNAGSQEANDRSGAVWTANSVETDKEDN